MKKKPKKASFFEYFEYDESLLLASRAGNFSASNELLKRFFNMRYLIGNGLSRTIVKLLDSWEFNHAFFEAYNNMCRYYIPNKGTTVRAYFKRIMKNSLISEATSSQVRQRINTLSLDDVVYSQEGYETALNDIVPACEGLNSDVTYYVNYMDAAGKFLNKDYNLKDIDKAIVMLRADGLTFEEVSDVLSMPFSKVRKSYLKFYKAVLKTIKTSSMDKIKRDLDELL